MLKISNRASDLIAGEVERNREERLNNSVTGLSLAGNALIIFCSSSHPTQVNVLIYLELIDPKLWTVEVTEKQVPHSGGRARMEDRE